MKRTIMMMHKPKDIAYEILSDYEIIYGTKSDNDLDEKFKKADYLVTSLDTVIDGQFMDKYPNIKLYNNFAVGHDNLNKQDGLARGVVMCNSPDCVTIPTAELTVTMMLALLRKLQVCSDKAIATDCNDKSGTEGNDLTGKTIGIIGLGAIGKQVAKLLMGFDCKFIYNRKSGQDAEFEAKFDARFGTIEDIMTNADIISIHCPLTPETENLINKDNLKLAKPGAMLINMARGKVVNNEAMIDALLTGKIAGAGLDVFENEPHIDFRLKYLDGTVLTPHIGGNTVETKERLYKKIKENIQAFEAGKTPVGKVN